MSLVDTRESISRALSLPKTHVIALHGPWGSGKTHLWKQIDKDLSKSGSTKTVYLSCATYSSIAALKSATITALLTHSSKLAKHGETIGKIIIGLINKKLPKDFQITANLLDIQALLPGLKGILPDPSIIVFDDIERAADLDVGDLLGFVTFLAEELNQKIILILNKDKFTDKTGEKWKRIREKSVSLEVELRASPEDYIRIGLGQLPATHNAIFSEKIRALGIKNIRTIQHMRRIYDALSGVGAFETTQWDGLIPSIVLFVALHQEVVQHSTEIKDALSSGKRWGPEKDWTPAQKAAAAILDQYKLGTIDAFESSILIPYLETGHLSEALVRDYASHISLRSKRQNSEKIAEEILNRFYWDSSATEEQLNNLLEKSFELQGYISRSTATSLAKAANSIGHTETENAIIYNWITKNEEAIDALAADPNLINFSVTMQYTHPRIKEIVEFRHRQKYKEFSLMEAIKYLTHNDSFGERQLAPFRTVTAADMEALIRKSDHDELPDVLRFFASRVRTRHSDQYFGQASTHFVDVCKRIIKDETSSRISKIISRAATDFDFASQVRSDE
ncbi:hypothetical protein HRD49_30485 [Corallococcus exiguus]|uniref:P-loop NTPase fold protein n=1 Tax=Corallococcus exiguus TaxID=83462 RepID=UPI00155F8C07|nr:P-loop NTPase fold protein [Corallococcus exiguus]NRD66091.1 hypothetical protein [Corallococcus exiguus]